MPILCNPGRQGSTGGESGDIDFLTQTAGYVHASVRAIPEFLSLERREIFDLAVRDTVPWQARNQDVIPHIVE
jgi:hypothetical protein